MNITIPDQILIPDDILQSVANNHLVATILWNRGYRTAEAVRAFLDPLAYVQSDPSDLPGIKKATKIIVEAVRDQQRICIYGDYDVDGLTATALLYRILKSIGGKVGYRIPNRFTDGYGISAEIVRELAEDGCQLLLTCDCGISNPDEVSLAKELGMRTVVTDHHTPPERPVLADAVINPKVLKQEHPLYDLPGVGVAYMLAIYIYRSLGLTAGEDLLQLVALGIVGDVVPVVKENRFLLQKGLNVLNSKRIYPGLKALFELTATTEADEEVIGFQIAPRLNAPGRLASADICVGLLIAEDYEEARKIAFQIDKFNEQRRLLLDVVMDDLSKLSPSGAILEFNKNWHQGIVGIAAGRLKDTFRVPVVLMTLAEDGRTVVGSARSVGGVNIFEALSKVSSCLDKFGGHAGAAGFSLKFENLSRFMKALQELLASCINDRGEESLLVDAEVELEDLSLDTYTILHRLAPFGQGNPAPRFFADRVTVKNCRSIGNAKHLRLTLSQGEIIRAAVWWWKREEIAAGTSAETVFALSSNTFNGKTTLQLVIEAFSATIKRDTIYRLSPFSIIDRRHHTGLVCDLAFEGSRCDFAEGRECMDMVNRYTLQLCDNLILTTIPPHIKVLREMLSIAHCKNLVLAFPQETVDRDPFIVRLMQALKFVSSKHGGITSLEFLSVYTAALEITVLQGMRMLRQSGYLLWETSGSQIQVSLLEGDRMPTQSIFYERMKQAEQESLAFREFMEKVEPDILKQMLQD